MAVGGVFLCAEEGDAKLTGTAFEAGDGFEEGGVFGDSGIEHAAALVVVLFVLRAASDDVAQKEVVQADGADHLAEGLAIVLRSELRVR